MNEVLKMIRYIKNRNLEYLNHILDENLVIGIFGAGGYAHTLIDELRKLNINVSFCVVDDSFYKGGLECNGIQVISVSECNETKKSAFLLIGFGMNYQNEEEEKKRIRKLIDSSIEIVDFEDQFVSSFYYMDYSFVLKYSKDLQRLYDSFEDDKSKQLLVDYINGRLSGNLNCMKNYQNSLQNDYSLELVFQKKTGKGIIYDCGAYDGTSAIQINDYLDSVPKIIAFECDDNNYSILMQNVKRFENIIPVKKGVWNQTTTLFVTGEGQEAKISDYYSDHMSNIIETVSLDDYTQEPVLAIFMDIEGAEYQALQGAKRIIEGYQPVLAVRMYHKMEDFIKIQPLIDSFNTKRRYRYYLRYNGHYRGAADLTLYAV